jgi:hypothetical protein
MEHVLMENDMVTDIDMDGEDNEHDMVMDIDMLNLIQTPNNLISI